MVHITLKHRGTDTNMPKKINSEILEKALKLLSGRLELEGSPHANLVVCGGAALIALDLVVRMTKDVDVSGGYR